MSSPESAAEREPPKRAIAMAVASVITAGLVGLSFYLGGWAYATRAQSFHEGRLQQVLARKPSEEQVLTGLKQEGMREVAAARRADEVVAAADGWAGDRRGDVLAQSSRAAVTRVLAAPDDDVAYFLYFDEAGTMIGFTYVPAPRRRAETTPAG